MNMREGDLRSPQPRDWIEEFEQRPFRKILVVAKYGEDMEWLAGVPSDWEVEVFDKGEHPTFARRLPNVGREAHTYLHWIVQNYRFLGQFDSVVFCQGNPFAHDAEFIEHLSDPSRRTYGAIVQCNSVGLPHCEFTLCDEFCKVFGLPVQDPDYLFPAGAQFRVNGDKIRSRPIAFYEALLALTELPGMHAWTLERLWVLIFELPTTPGFR